MNTAIDTVMAFRRLGIDIPMPSENHQARVAEKKMQLLEMARAGKPRPLYRERLGQELSKYTCKTARDYDAGFDKQIRVLCPDWFVGRSDLANSKKQQLLEMARSGKPRPSQKTKLGKVLSRYTHGGSGSYDAEFDRQIRALRPDWFVNQSSLAAKKKKQQLLEMARSGKPRPSQKTKLGKVLSNYIRNTSRAYDAEFDEQIRMLRPDWFRTTPQVSKDKAA